MTLKAEPAFPTSSVFVEYYYRRIFMSQNKPLLIGYHVNIQDYYSSKPFFSYAAENGKGVDFLLCHIDPVEGTLEDNCEFARKSAAVIKAMGLPFIMNSESQNFIENQKTSDGHDWANRDDGTFRLNLPQCYIEALNSSGNCMGVMYDEFEHVIINRNLSIAMASKKRLGREVFPVLPSKNQYEQGELLSNQLSQYASELKNRGAKEVSGEHVFPVLFHSFARNGIIPNFKSQKESASDVQFACASGAALQYGTPLYNCVDMWYRMTFPGHSANEMYHNLKFACLTGVDLVYVEAANVFTDGDGKPSDIGKEFVRFCEEYKGRERSYNVQDFRPEIAVIHYDDTFWGQGTEPVMWKNMLFGNPAVRVKKCNREWIYAMNIITHGETGNGGISWDRVGIHSLKKHRSFLSMNNAAVFDDRVTADKLQSLKLAFVCGPHISGETLAAVENAVRENGLTAVVSPRYAPSGMKAPFFGYSEKKDGKGVWIAARDFRCRSLKKRLSSFLGRKGEMRFVFGENEIRMKISSDGESFEVLK